jgi:hypothetical protein
MRDIKSDDVDDEILREFIEAMDQTPRLITEIACTASPRPAKRPFIRQRKTDYAAFFLSAWTSALAMMPRQAIVLARPHSSLVTYHQTLLFMG